MRKRLVCLIALGALAHPALVSAGEDTVSWQEISAEEFESQLASCPASVRATVAASHEAHADESRYARRAEWIVRTDVAWGYGLDGVVFSKAHIIQLGSCFEMELTDAFETSSPYQRRTSIANSGAPAPPEWAERALGMPLETLRPDDPRHALPQLLVELGRRHPTAQNLELDGCPAAPGDRPSLSEPLMPVQPWHPGRPRRWPSVWSEGYVVLASQQEPRATWHRRDMELWEVELPSRYRAVAVAQYDRTLDQHRWFLVTRWCALGHIDWLGQRHDWVLGSTHGWVGQFGPEIIAVHLTSGEVRRLSWPAIVNDDGLAYAETVCTVPLRDGAGTCLRPALRGRRLRGQLCNARRCESPATVDIDALLANLAAQQERQDLSRARDAR